MREFEKGKHSFISNPPKIRRQDQGLVRRHHALCLRCEVAHAYDGGMGGSSFKVVDGFCADVTGVLCLKQQQCIQK